MTATPPSKPPFDELPAAVAVSDEGMDLAGKQINVPWRLYS